jgi:hypothetical protein
VKKIPTLFQRDPENRSRVTSEVTPGCEWVLAGEGVATRKWDGTCTLLDECGRWWARREVKPGKETPPNFVAVDHDPVTGKLQGWEPISQSAFSKFHAEALDLQATEELRPGTYELVGPKINGNPDGFGSHHLIRHGHASVTEDVLTITSPPPRDHEGLGLWLWSRHWEGLVFHREPGNPDTEMVKIKRRDYFPGQTWPSPEAV